MTRIAYIINSLEGGGAALPAPDIIDFLGRSDFEVVVFALTGRDRRSLPSFQSAGIEVRIRDGGERDHVAALTWLDRQLKAWSSDLIWTSLTRATLLGQLIGLKQRVPVISWQHNAFLKPANRRLLRLMQSHAALWIADSDMVADLTRQRLGVEADRILVWPLIRANPNAPQATPWRAGEPVRIGTLGRLHPVKGYDLLIEAVRLLGDDIPPVSVTIAGEGRERERLTELAKGMPVTLPGFLPATAFLASQHLYVQPSLAEGLCVAAHEAMAAGLPVVATSVGELPRSIVAGTGRIVPPGDTVALAAALRQLLESPEAMADMGKAARAHVLERYGPERFEAAGRAVVARVNAILAR